jgi:hypothetical protein
MQLQLHAKFALALAAKFALRLAGFSALRLPYRIWIYVL